MKHSFWAGSIAILVPSISGLIGCASTNGGAESVRNIDDLLTHIERVNVDVVVSKDAVHTALGHLSALVSPNFQGDATQAFAELKTSITDSESKVSALSADIPTMTGAAEELLQRWTSDLESFGNTRMRQRSQARLDETRTRYQAVLSSAQSAIIALNSFNADLHDQALYLAHDLNSTAVASILPDVRALHEQARELDARVESCSASARSYVAVSALHGQVEVAPEEPAATEPVADTAQKSTLAKRKSTTLKPRSTQSSPAGAAPAPTTPPTPSPAATPSPTTMPPAASGEAPAAPSAVGPSPQ